MPETCPDLRACAEAIRHGSRSFHAASLILPKRVRFPAYALYAFCRLADDAVDEATGCRHLAVERLRLRLDRVYAGRPENAPMDRAFARVVEAHAMPRALPEALIEGLEWDAEGRQCDSLSDLAAYAARVASAVGAMMAVLMGVRDRDLLARACDLGCAMQFTNIARDVGEDARMGRVYLPAEWLDEARIDRAALLAAPSDSPALSGLVARLLAEADRLYTRSEAGIARLPRDCRPAIFAARHIYAAIGTEVRRMDCRSVARRAVVTDRRKIGLAARALAASALPPVFDRQALRAPVLPECAFLVDAAARPDASRKRLLTGTDDLLKVLDTLTELSRREKAVRHEVVSR